ncbi:MAG TPA: PASTA domain-containing protein [Bacteroidota bacterium]|nr:PASTA domain-containing protein [Bacteroidota bacterium]
MDLRSLDYKRYLKQGGVVLAIFLVLLFVVNNLVMPYYVQQGKTTKVPSVVGENVDRALITLRQAGLTPRVAETRIDKQIPIGSVALQNPPGGSEVKFGRGVYLTVSGGEPLVDVPSLRGKSLRDARFTLERTALVLGTIQYRTSAEFPENTIIDQAIPEGTEVKNGSRIDVTVSQGRDSTKTPVPNVTMKSLVEAQKLLDQTGYKIGTVTYRMNPDLLPNTVLDQLPKGGELLSLGQPVSLIVSQKGEVKDSTTN